MTKNIFRLGLVLAICGAMLGCKKADDAAGDLPYGAQRRLAQERLAVELHRPARGAKALRAGDTTGAPCKAVNCSSAEDIGEVGGR